MKTSPILFSAPMVRAILAGQKTQTRRALTPQPDAVETHHFLSGPRAGKPYEIIRCYNPPARLKPCNSGWSVHCPGPFRILGGPGDELWVKETYRASHWFDDRKPIDIPEAAAIRYEADGAVHADKLPVSALFDQGRIRQSIFMRQWMSRLTLTITDVRIERLQEISEEDAIAEGCDPTDGALGSDSIALNCHPACTPWPIRRYRALWNSINPTDEKSWQANPFVVAYTFTTKPQ